jgi:hypothetical protein
MCSNIQATTSLGLSQILGVFGFFLGCTSLGWQIWTYFRGRKEDIQGELTAGVKCLSPDKIVAGLFLEIYNNGSIPVYIETVSLVWGNEILRKSGSRIELHFQPLENYEGPLKQGDGRRCYALQRDFLLMNKDACSQPQEKIWISVKSAKGEVLRIKGDKVLCFLKSIISVSDKEKIGPAPSRG